MIVRVRQEAIVDLADGYRYYEYQSRGLGDYFLDSLFADIDSLSLFAGIHGKHFGFYRLLAKRFPFAIYYRLEDSEAQVLAVLDCRRDPNWIRKRLM